MRQRRETVEHPFGTIKARMGATHFLMKTLPRVAAEMALHVLAYNMTRVMNIMGTKPLNSGDDGVVTADMRPSAGADPPRAAETPDRQCYRQCVFARPRPSTDIRTVSTAFRKSGKVLELPICSYAGLVLACFDPQWPNSKCSVA